MRILLTALALIFTISSMASASVLITASPLGQGKWGLQGTVAQITNFNNNGTDTGVTNIGGSIGYGIMDKLDIYVPLAYGIGSGFPVDVTATSLGLNLKYTLLDERENLPVSLAVAGGYGMMNVDMSAAGTTDLAKMGLGLIVSKMMIPFIPYGSLTYYTNTADGNDAGTTLSLTVGGAMAFSEQLSGLLEVTSHSMTPSGGGSSFNMTEIAAGVNFLL